jgi:cytochrome b pre-mRNA-processing protein 3
MFGWFRRDRNAGQIERLNDAVMAQARQPFFYSDLEVPDTIEGRFEMVAVHAFLLVRRLDSGPEPGPDLARDLTDAIFSRFEIALRETGVSDIAVPKRMKKLASSYLGRAQAYGQGLAAENRDLLPTALARNILGIDDGQVPEQSVIMASYVRAADDALARMPMEQVLMADVRWPDVSKLQSGQRP